MENVPDLKNLNRPSNYSDRQKPPVHPQTGKLIAELGLRYPATATTDREAHARRLRLLAEDVADIPPPLLAQAIDRYVRVPGSEYLPKASQLISIAQSFREQAGSSIGPGGATTADLHAHCDKLNRMDWVIYSERPYFVNKREKSDGKIEHFVDRKI